MDNRLIFRCFTGDKIFRGTQAGGGFYQDAGKSCRRPANPDVPKKGKPRAVNRPGPLFA
jgi:hypothetical protein